MQICDAASRLPACPRHVEPFTRTRRVRIGDAGVDRTPRLDGVARYLQDIGYDHLEVCPDGSAHQAWIVRRSVIDMIRPISFGEIVTLRRWTSATSTRWCSMRVRIEGSEGGLIETESAAAG
ncbi:acyl-ACP thioesterase domain-containing protein [Nocardia anaemiae]|uniref:acyl-ACP thioesterase domain-containing protein n=1 Tax=Nocardia anaemiae TaxID=263910 RepID=UPI0009FF7EE1